MKKVLLGFLAVGFLFSSCGNSGSESGESKESAPKKVELAKEVCTYSYTDNTTIKWTAFKFTKKVGVGGVIDSFSVKLNKVVETPKEILSDLEFEVYPATVNSNNEERDAKLRAFFFGKMDSTDVISGKVVDIIGNMREGSLMVSMTLNGQTKNQPMKYFVEGSSVTINGQMDLNNWGAQKAVESLNNVCKDLHTGEDGVSKLWSTVDIEIVSVLKQECK
jgi:hypothetical protein